MIFLKVAIIFFLSLPIGATYGRDVSHSCVHQAIHSLLPDKYPLLSALHGSNPMDEIWSLRKAGMHDEAARLEEEVITVLRGEFTIPRSVGEGAGGARIYPYDLELSGVGKRKGSHWSSNVEAEVAAYKVDKLYEINLTPITISREAENRFQSMQLFYPDAKQARLAGVPALEADEKKMRIFDYLIDNLDRRETNYLISPTGRIIAIDHGVAFHNARKVPFSPFPYKLEELDLTFFKSSEGELILSKLKSVTDETLTRELSEVLSETEIKKFIQRRDELVKAAEAM